MSNNSLYETMHLLAKRAKPDYPFASIINGKLNLKQWIDGRIDGNYRCIICDQHLPDWNEIGVWDKHAIAHMKEHGLLALL